jgi:hypothetical protein
MLKTKETTKLHESKIKNLVSKSLRDLKWIHMTTQELYILNFKTATWTQSWRTIQML